MTVADLKQVLVEYKDDTPVHVIEWDHNGTPYLCDLNTVTRMKKARNIFGWTCLHPTGTGRGKVVLYYSAESTNRDKGIGIGIGGRHEQP